MIKDQKERATSTTVATTGTYSAVSTYPATSVSESVYDMGANGETQISTVSAVESGDNTKQSETQTHSEKELTFEDILNNLEKDKQLVQTLLSNLTIYCKLV